MLRLSVEQALEMARWCEAKGRAAEAEGWYRQAGADGPAMHAKGMAAWRAGKMGEAAEWFARAVERMPSNAGARLNLGAALLEAGQTQRAIDCFREAIGLSPDLGDACYNLGKALKRMGDLEGAVRAYEEAIRVGPVRAVMHNGLGDALLALGQAAEAEQCFRKAIGCDATYAVAYNNLGGVLLERGEMDGAMANFRKAVELVPEMAGAWSNLANALSLTGREAVSTYREAVRMAPDDPRIGSNLLYAMHLDPAFDARAIGEECRRWAARHAEPLRALMKPHGNERSAERRLRVGYVSPDFNGHAVGRFMWPLLRGHDRGVVEVFCYADVARPDAQTARLRAEAGTWREIVGMTDEAVAQLVRADGIDILVDLAMHANGGRPLIFARKPAPVQVAYLAYGSTTGMAAMDYRFSDPYLDPVGTDESVYTERTVRLPETYWCYEAPEGAPECGPLPLAETGQATFGCLNNFAKVSAGALAAWGEVLRAVPGSRLVMYAHAGSHREEVLRKLEALGVARERCEFVGYAPLGDYLRRYLAVDIALDTFPYSGGTTTCDALWMGVPVVTLRGQTAVGRSGVSLLSNVGLAELVADSEEAYVRVAVELARDRRRLMALRSTLRGRMHASPLMNERLFARRVEAAYRGMWRGWCTG